MQWILNMHIVTISVGMLVVNDFGTVLKLAEMWASTSWTCAVCFGIED